MKDTTIAVGLAKNVFEIAISREAGKVSKQLRVSRPKLVSFFGCLRCLLLVMCTHPVAKKALTLHLARIEGRECYLGCNLMHRKVLASSHQHLMAEAPADVRPESSDISCVQVR